MIASGERMDFSALSRPTADKHSTGGVGRQDHAAAGAAGRRLRRRGAAAVRPRPRPHRRHARQARVDPRLAGRAVQRGDAARSSRTSARSSAPPATGLAPADKKLYALRDVTGTVEAIPLIAVLDHEQEDRRGHRRAGARRQGRHRGVHEGRRPTPASSPRRWSRSAPTPGSHTVALLTDMSTPLGLTAGNALEVARVRRGAGRRRPGRRRRADRSRWRARCSPAPGATDVDPAEQAGRRLRDGRLAADDRGPGRRPGRARCPTAQETARRDRPGRRAC